MNDVARYRSDPRGGYFIDAKFNDKGAWKTVEHLPTQEMARLYVIQLTADDQMRHVEMRDTRDWDFVTDEPAKPKRQLQREAKAKRTPAAPVKFSFTDD